MRRRQPGQRERAGEQAEVAEGDVAVAADQKQAHDDSGEPRRDQQPAKAGADGDNDARRALKQRGRLAVKLRIVVTPPAGKPVSQRAAVTLRKR